MAAVTVNHRVDSYQGNKRVTLLKVSVATTGDTLVEPNFGVVDSLQVTPIVATTSGATFTASSKTFTFYVGTATDLYVRIEGS